LNLVQRIAGAARLLATGKLALSTGFEGAQMQRRLVAWRAGGESINSLILQGGELQRARARQLVRTNPYAANASASFTAHAVGCGIKPSSLVEDSALKDQIQRLWLAWTDEADADGLTDFYGLQAMAARAMFEAGECFLRFRPRRPDDGLTVPLQLQMLSSEHLPLAKCETLPSGNEIIFGIELDRIGRRVAYHFHRTHPGDVRQRGVGETVRVPAEQVLHVFHPIAEGQIRGVPWVAPAMVRLWLLDQYDDAELDRKKVAAMFAGFVTRPGADDVMGEDAAQKDTDGAALIGLQPGTMQLLLPGEDIKFSDPADVGGSYEAFQYRTLLACCSAMGVPYTNVTGDLRQANYSGTARPSGPPEGCLCDLERQLLDRKANRKWPRRAVAQFNYEPNLARMLRTSTIWAIVASTAVVVDAALGRRGLCSKRRERVSRLGFGYRVTGTPFLVCSPTFCSTSSS
jgi:lambda family phage portal protein